MLWGRREPCSQLRTALVLTQRKLADTAWLACKLSRRQLGAEFEVWPRAETSSQILTEWNFFGEESIVNKYMAESMDDDRRGLKRS
jgi:hypothetical protein